MRRHFYLYYTPNGALKHISPVKLDDDAPYIRVPYAAIKGFFELTANPDDWCVGFTGRKPALLKRARMIVARDDTRQFRVPGIRPLARTRARDGLLVVAEAEALRFSLIGEVPPMHDRVLPFLVTADYDPEYILDVVTVHYHDIVTGIAVPFACDGFYWLCAPQYFPYMMFEHAQTDQRT